MPYGKALHHVFRRGERQARQVGQRFDAGVADFLAGAADVAFEADEQGLQAFELELLQFGARHHFVAAIKDHGMRNGT